MAQILKDWYRSWPDHLPEHLQNRPRIVDNLPRLYMSGWDYNTIEPWPRHNLFLLEWDMALDRFGMETFTEHALRTPKEITTAAYRLSDGRTLRNGMGCIYLPYEVVTEYKLYHAENTPHQPFSDVLLFKWYGTPQICPLVFPQHLNT